MLIADAVVIGQSPILLLDEIEYAGINRSVALELLKSYNKIFILANHDPRTALLSDFRLIMHGGGMANLVHSSRAEKLLAEKISMLDKATQQIKNKLWMGQAVDGDFGEKLEKGALAFTPALEGFRQYEDPQNNPSPAGLIERAASLGRVFESKERVSS